MSNVSDQKRRSHSIFGRIEEFKSKTKYKEYKARKLYNPKKVGWMTTSTTNTTNIQFPNVSSTNEKKEKSRFDESFRNLYWYRYLKTRILNFIEKDVQQ
ncbi:hypothetical protein KY314_00315 [Candidatus Woesearchaeota archaeon]|nr:hypothetical protein [Candidatus Woesearchaeota archaeon]